MTAATPGRKQCIPHEILLQIIEVMVEASYLVMFSNIFRRAFSGSMCHEATHKNADDMDWS
ncbi:predicted protein [Sclerotinia sclerotiorum 1980 UF-70]|uniref:Uncharacterized protein n=2 Tax=Sclerotinia sclerotiorum (strain ATCC 18683 / 1980 / Ss-1) TaxID=665079 RepID=A0A1D9QHT4_SCLS1|nr:predicted protein [Sclerotinia sclerotiorum 1980 UF-70]APA14461.1 hypothetical protein sscle_13g092310 [Sclerotinia sclerotiorum 1980 UF-70]EDO03875.1 predicted protein [Sclerotinia sclerotiorum 1980 UF-70]